MKLELSTREEIRIMLDSALMLEEARGLAEVLADHFLEKAKRLSAAIWGRADEQIYCRDVYGNPETRIGDVMETLYLLETAIDYLKGKEAREEAMIGSLIRRPLEIEDNTTDYMEAIDRKLVERMGEMSRVWEVVTLASHSKGVDLTEFNELIEKYAEL